VTVANPLWRWQGEHPVVDDDDILHFDGRWVPLGPVEARMARELVSRAGELVRRPDLEHAGWPGEAVRPNTADRLFHRLRKHLSVVGLALVTVRGHGYVLERPTDLT
jgi:DNA-binding winged helix-turn-helix (wHTH) protein